MQNKIGLASWLAAIVGLISMALTMPLFPSAGLTNAIVEPLFPILIGWTGLSIFALGQAYLLRKRFLKENEIIQDWTILLFYFLFSFPYLGVGFGSLAMKVFAVLTILAGIGEFFVWKRTQSSIPTAR